jgi:hypothetical protein
MKFSEDLGAVLHTALRKCCDSSPTSAAWNLLYELKEDQWADLLDTIRAEFKSFAFVKGGKSHNDQLAVRLKQATFQWEPYGKGHICVALHCVFHCFSDNDWYGFAGFLDSVVVKPKKAKAKAA